MTFALDDLAANYRRDGYCVLRGAIDDVELAFLQAETRQHPDMPPVPAG